MKYLRNYHRNVKMFISSPKAHWAMARANGYSNTYLAADAAITLAGLSIAGAICYYL
jgi:hypothetical protein